LRAMACRSRGRCAARRRAMTPQAHECCRRHSRDGDRVRSVRMSAERTRPLGVDDILVAMFAERAPEARDLTACRAREHLRTPAAGGDRNNLRDRRVKPHQRGKRLFHHPGKPGGRPMAPGLGQRRHVMDHIAKRGRLDEQDIGHRHESLRSTGRVTACHRARTRASARYPGIVQLARFPLKTGAAWARRALGGAAASVAAQRDVYA
jgi:hypothetical protein